MFWLDTRKSVSSQTAGSLSVFGFASDEIRNIHFIVQVFSHSEDLKQEHHLPRVLHDFGVLLRQQILEPALARALRRGAHGCLLS